MIAVLLGVLSIFWIQRIEASVLVADTTMSRMVELNADAPFCALYNDRGIIQKMVLGADPRKVRQISSNLVADLEETCKASRDKGKNQAPGSGLIYPGTKWCGPGNVANSYDDLGQHSAEDACCREHDHCPFTIAPQQCIHGICNNSPFTRSHCDCDAKFRRCLQNLNTEVANTLGALFFNVIQVTCFKERRPCSQWQSCGLQVDKSPSYLLNELSEEGRGGRRLLLTTLFSMLRDFVSRQRIFPRDEEAMRKNERLRGSCVRPIVLAVQVPTERQVRAHDASEYEHMNSEATEGQPRKQRWKDLKIRGLI